MLQALGAPARQPSRFERLVLAAVALGSVLVPLELSERLPGLCLWRLITGRRCPGCSMGRAFIALGHGHLAPARQANALSPYVYALWWWLTIAPWQAWLVGRLRRSACRRHRSRALTRSAVEIPA